MVAVGDNDNAPASAGAFRFLSVCSGIEAASCAWPAWQAVAFSEIEKFPSAVLAHHYPDVPNLGDFTAIDPTTLGRVDIFCGGTPCQAFSVAGLRQSLADERGNLSLEFVRLAHELAAGNGLRNVVWENVCGVLNTPDNALGCFLGGLVGADDPIPSPAGRSWPNAGMVDGPKGRAAWRVFDAQFFGLAQRRKRIIVVADFGNGADPAAVLFERVGMSGNTPPSREARKDVAGAATDCFSASSIGAYREADVSGADRAAGGDNGGGSENLVTATLTATYGEQSGQDMMAQNMLVAHAIQAGALRTNPNSGPDGVGVQEGLAYTLEARAEVQAVSVTGTIAHTLKAEGADASEDGTGRGTPIIAFSSKDYGGDASVDLSPTLRSGGHTGSHANAGVMPAIAWSIMPQNSGKDYKARQVEVAQPLMAGGPVGGNQGGDYIQQPVTVALRGREGGATAELGGEVATALRASSGGGDKPHVLAMHETGQGWWKQDDVAGTLRAEGENRPSRPSHVINVASAVRRLTPRECERLMGFPDDYTAIPYGHVSEKKLDDDYVKYMARGNPKGLTRSEVARLASDGPRYKALGNSWAVPLFTWLGRRIEQHMPSVVGNNNQAPTPANDNNEEAERGA